MKLFMTAEEYDKLADFLTDRFAEGVKRVGPGYSLVLMAEEIGGGITDVTLRRLMDKRIKRKAGLESKTIRALIVKYGPIILKFANLDPDDLYKG